MITRRSLLIALGLNALAINVSTRSANAAPPRGKMLRIGLLYAIREKLDPESNSIAILVKHIAGNMRSRWTDFLTTDGEKPGRDRDSEFEDPPATRQELLQMWEAGWTALFGALEPLVDADLTRTVTVRGEPYSVMQAINRQLAHYTGHIGQIVLLAKHFQSDRWQTLSIPRRRR